jgi:hypothetical protein
MYSVSVLAAALIASVVPALIVGVALVDWASFQWALLAVVVAYVITFGYIMLVGVPCVAVLRRLEKLKLMSVALAGFWLGAGSYALLMWVVASGMPYSYQSGNEWIVVDGSRTLVGWYGYLVAVTSVGTLGAFTGGVFYAVLRRLPT